MGTTDWLEQEKEKKRFGFFCLLAFFMKEQQVVGSECWIEDLPWGTSAGTILLRQPND